MSSLRLGASQKPTAKNPRTAHAGRRPVIRSRTEVPTGAAGLWPGAFDEPAAQSRDRIGTNWGVDPVVPGGCNRVIRSAAQAMNFHISRDGRQYGPYPIQSLPEMLRNGNVLPTDLLFAEGQSTWVIVSDYLNARLAPVAPTPPPLPTSGLRVASSAGGSTAIAEPPVVDAAGDLERQVLDGGRYVIYQYCVSILVMTFKRSSSVVFLRGNESGAGQAFGYSLISLAAGWWGFPWGPIWTIGSLVTNANGGTDVTQEMLAGQLGPARAAAIIARRKPPSRRGGMQLFRWGLVGAGALLLLMVGLLVYGGVRDGREARAQPVAAGEAAFRAANRQIGSYQGTVGFGNTAKAAAVAEGFSKTMLTLRERLFEGGKKSGFSASGHQFLTYCELHDSQCVFIVHVPELRRFSADAKESLGEMAWTAAQAALKEKAAGRPGMRLAVGLRGIALYDRVLLGRWVSKVGEGENGLAETITSSRAERRLFGFFQDPGPSPSGASSPSPADR
jgi:hypothetical protein